jgi:RNA polymerase sigma factor (sigma-70 family)
MDWIDEETASEKHDDPKALLDAYCRSGGKDAPFRALVDRFAGLVFTSALRRTGNPASAEEITQNVFALLARKAASLRSHPNLSAWIFRTTQLECAKTMRSEMRHQRKLDALASESPSTTADDSAAWREALPALDASLDQLAEKDRALVIQRFFERKRFAEIAGSTGKSEAACKMQLKRALEKLATLLRSRGIALSVPVIATGLSAEFAKAAPLATQTLATKALAASSGITTSTVLTNTLLTMSTAKSSAITAAAARSCAATRAPVHAANACSTSAEERTSIPSERRSSMVPASRSYCALRTGNRRSAMTTARMITCIAVTETSCSSSLAFLATSIVSFSMLRVSSLILASSARLYFSRVRLSSSFCLAARAHCSSSSWFQFISSLN